MANCAIYIKGSDEIRYFIKDCVQTGRNFKGSNSSVSGVKEYLFDVKWTEDLAEPVFDAEGQRTGFNGKVSVLSEAKRYQGKVVSTKEDVNAVTRELIASKYPAHEEIKILRQKIAGNEEGWVEYKNYVEALITAGKAFKEKEM